MSELQQQLSYIRDNLNIEGTSLFDIISKYKDEDNEFLIDEFINNSEINLFYTRDLYYIINDLLENNKIENITKLNGFLEEKLKNLSKISEGNIYIFINIYLKISKNLKNIKRLYKEFQNNNYINVSNIENFCEAFLRNKEISLFIETFLYNQEGWIRSIFYSYKGGDFIYTQKGILSLNKEEFILFLDELSKQENIGTLIKEYEYRKNHDFIDEIFKKARKSNLYEKIYNLLVAQIIYSNSPNNYNNKSIFSQININLFNELKNKGVFTYGKFFKNIFYKEPEYYYFFEFDEFIIKTLETKKDVEDFINIKELKNGNEYVIRNAYFTVKERLKLDKIQKYFEEILGKKIEKYNEDRKKALEKSKEYEEEKDNEIKEEIKVHIELALDKKQKYFVPELLNDFLDREQYLDGFNDQNIKIKDLIKKQINRYFTFQNLEINTKALESFKKTETGYSSYGFILDGSFEVVYKSAKKIGYNLEEKKDRLVGFFPFQYDGDIVKELINFFDLEEIKEIVNIYKTYDDIRKYQQYNISTLYNEKPIIFKENQDIKNDYIEIIEKSLKDDELSKYNYESLLRHLFALGKEKSFFTDLEKEYKTDKNFFIDGLEKASLDENFDRYNIINEILIKEQDKGAFLWRLDQLKEGFVEYITPKRNSGVMMGLGGKEKEFDFDKSFIKSLGEYENYDTEIENIILEILEESFKKYNDFDYIVYCKYIWGGLNQYLKGLKDLKLKTNLIGGIAKILKDEVDINKIISFKLAFKDLGERFILRVEKEIEAKKNNKDRIKNQGKRISNLQKDLNIAKKENQLLENQLFSYKENDIFLYKNLLIVEGKTDQQIIEYTLYKILNLERKDINYAIINVGGSNNFKPLIDIFSKNGNLKNIVCLMDFDRAGYTQWESDKNEETYNTECNNIYEGLCYSFQKESTNIYKVLLPLPNNINLEKQVKKEISSKAEIEKSLDTEIINNHYGEYSLLDIELMFYGINKEIDSNFFIQSNEIPNKPIISIYYQKNNSNKINFLNEIVQKSEELFLNKNELFVNIKKIIKNINKLLNS